MITLSAGVLKVICNPDFRPKLWRGGSGGEAFLIMALSLFAISSFAQPPSQPQKSVKMKVAVWDTYVTKKDGSIMHFDIIAPTEVKDTNIIYGYGKEYLKKKGQEGQPLTFKQCRFCHIREIWPQWESDIKAKGYFILEMEGCNE